MGLVSYPKLPVYQASKIWTKRSHAEILAVIVVAQRQDEPTSPLTCGVFAADGSLAGSLRLAAANDLLEWSKRAKNVLRS